MIVIGIDPGVHTGFAIYSKISKSIITHFEGTFWDVFYFLELNIFPQYKVEQIEVVIENPALQKGIFARYTKSIENSKNPRGTENAIRNSVGQNTRDAKLWIELFKLKKVKKIHEYKPTKSGQKWSKDFCKQVTGIASNSEHTRDAIRLCFSK